MDLELLIRRATGGRDPSANAIQLIEGLRTGGRRAGLMRPSRLAMFLGQVSHESLGFVYDQELWGPTAAQKRYEDRADLGHSTKEDGEAFKYRGRTMMQATGRNQYVRFRDWARATFKSLRVPDFERDPDAILTDPWEGLFPIYYWERGNPTGRSLNRYADDGNYYMVTLRINGGTNGYQDRIAWYTRYALVLLGYGPRELPRFQQDRNLTVDNIPGPVTMAALHSALVLLDDIEDSTPAKTHPAVEKAPAALWDRLVALTRAFMKGA